MAAGVITNARSGLRPPPELPLFSKAGIFALDAILSNGGRNA